MSAARDWLTHAESCWACVVRLIGVLTDNRLNWEIDILLYDDPVGSRLMLPKTGLAVQNLFSR